MTTGETRAHSVTVYSLLPGDVVSMGGRQAVFVTHTGHPIWPKLRLVTWRLDDGSWSHDALAIHQEVGEAVRSTPEQRESALRWALLNAGKPPWG